MDDVREIDQTPSAELLIEEDGITSEVVLAQGEVLSVKNLTMGDHRLQGGSFDTGIMQPGDEVLVRFEEVREVEWRDLLGDAEGTIWVEAIDPSQ